MVVISKRMATNGNTRRNDVIIIIEGPDGTGKTTLANSLLKSLEGHDFELMHRTHITDMPKSDLFEIYRGILTSGKNLILDRAWYSEMCYGPVFRGESHISKSGMHILEELLNMVGGFVIYCHTDRSYELSHERGEDYVDTREQHEQVCANYEQLFKGLKHKVVILEYEL